MDLLPKVKTTLKFATKTFVYGEIFTDKYTHFQRKRFDPL